jgi:hypothetical protein
MRITAPERSLLVSRSITGTVVFMPFSQYELGVGCRPLLLKPGRRYSNIDDPIPLKVAFASYKFLRVSKGMSSAGRMIYA